MESNHREPSADLDALAGIVFDAATEVHRHLGPGFQESVYEEALSLELSLRRVPFRRQPVVALRYKGTSIGAQRLDLLVGEQLVVELKSVDMLLAAHVAQVLSYLRATGLCLGLLINFNAPLLKQGFRRVIYHPRSEPGSPPAGEPGVPGGLAVNCAERCDE